MRIRLGVGGLLGAATSAPSLWGAAKWILDWKGRYDTGAEIVGGLSDIPGWVYLIGLVVGGALIWWDSRRATKEITIDISPLMAASAVTFIALGCWGWFFYDRWRGPIEWDFNVGSPVTWQRVQGQPLWIGGFQVMGRNRWDEPVLPSEAYIRSDINGQVVALLLDGGKGYGPVKDVAIPGQVKFVLRASLHPPQPQLAGQLLVTDFLATFGRFTLVFKYEGGESVHRFSADDVTKIIANANAASSPLPSQPKAVVPRSQ